MTHMTASHTVVGRLEARLFNKYGELVKDYGVVSEDAPISLPPGTRLSKLSGLGPVSNLLLLIAVLSMLHYSGALAVCLLVFGLVTNVGVNFEAAAFSNSGPQVNTLNYHDSGTGTTPAAITDTALVSPAGAPRVLGVQSSSTNIYQTVATIGYASVLLIGEWGLFSALTGGTLWDRRVINIITTAPGDQIEWTYTCTFAPGGI